MNLEVVVVPVSAVDRAKQFNKAMGWREDADFVGDEEAPFLPVDAAERGAGTEVERKTYGSFLSFDDPDGRR